MQQDSSKENINDLSYKHQNRVGLNRFENKLVEQQPCKIWDRNYSNWNFGGFLKGLFRFGDCIFDILLLKTINVMVL